RHWKTWPGPAPGFFCLRPMRPEPVSQGAVHSSLPPFTARFKRFNDIGVIAHGQLHLGRVALRAPHALELLELFLAQFVSIRVGSNASINRGILFRGGRNVPLFKL